MFQVLTLTDQASWSPPDLLAKAVAQVWPQNLQTSILGELASIVYERTAIPSGAEVVNPRGVSKSGVWQWIKSESEKLGIFVNTETGLTHGDLVIYPGSPVIMIPKAAPPVGFIGNFLVLRPISVEVGTWLWGILNSTVGRDFISRAASNTGSIAPRFTPSILLESVPKQSPLQAHLYASISSILLGVQAVSGGAVDTAQKRTSWFKSVDLSLESAWGNLFASQRDLDAFEGTPMSHLITQIWVGKSPKTSAEIDHETHPLINHKTVMTGEYSSTTAYSKNELIPSGVIVVPAVGDRAGVLLTDRPACLAGGVIAFQVKPDADKEKIQQFFHSEVAQTQRRVLTKGVAVPYLRKDDVGLFKLPPSLNDALPKQPPLNEELDSVLGL